MAKSAVESSSEFLKPSLFDALKQELLLLEAMEPGSKSMSEAIADLLPLIKGCRDRGHSWVRISQSFQKFLPGMTVGMLRKYAFALDPSLKGTVKGVNLTGESGSLIPALAHEEEGEDGLDVGDESRSMEEFEESADLDPTESKRKAKRAAVDF